MILFKKILKKKMEQVNIKNIPDWLHNSDLYKNITDDEDFLVPKNNFKTTKEINNLEDFILYYNTIKFWGMDYSQDFYDYCLNNKQEVLNYLKNYNCKDNLELKEFISELERSSNIRIKYSIDINTYLKSNNIYKLTIFILEKNNIVFKLSIYFFCINKIFYLSAFGYKIIFMYKNQNIISQLIESIEDYKKYKTNLIYELDSIQINVSKQSELSFDAFGKNNECCYPDNNMDRVSSITLYNLENPESSFEIKISKFNINHILSDLMIIEEKINNLQGNNMPENFRFINPEDREIRLKFTDIIELTSVNISSNL
uniref:Uncharacterized protein n=1 Tax=viral metagenome TaxID=1070528 RepID=A0A6C0ADL9_9ZZZZ